MMSIESIFSLIVVGVMAMLLAFSTTHPLQTSIYGLLIANDFAESTIKSEYLGRLYDYFDRSLISNQNAAKAGAELESYAKSISPSPSICLSISDLSGDNIVNDCAANSLDFKSSFAVERDVLIRDAAQTKSMQRIRFTAYFY